MYAIIILTHSNQHLREALLQVSGAKATAALLNLTRSGLLEEDVIGAKKTLFQSGEESTVAMELALQTLRKNGDYEALLNFFHRKQRLEDMLLLMAKHHKEIKEEMHLWTLNVINLANILYEETSDVNHLYSVYHFICRYCNVFDDWAGVVIIDRSMWRMSSIPTVWEVLSSLQRRMVMRRRKLMAVHLINPLQPYHLKVVAWSIFFRWSKRPLWKRHLVNSAYCLTCL